MGICTAYADCRRVNVERIISSTATSRARCISLGASGWNLSCVTASTTASSNCSKQCASWPSKSGSRCKVIDIRGKGRVTDRCEKMSEWVFLERNNINETPPSKKQCRKKVYTSMEMSRCAFSKSPMRNESSNVEAGQGEHYTRDTAVLGESQSMAVAEPEKKIESQTYPIARKQRPRQCDSTRAAYSRSGQT